MRISTEHQQELEKEALQYLLNDKDALRYRSTGILKSTLLSHFAIQSRVIPEKYNIDLYVMYLIIDKAAETFRSIMRTENLLKGENK